MEEVSTLRLCDSCSYEFLSVRLESDVYSVMSRQENMIFAGVLFALIILPIAIPLVIHQVREWLQQPYRPLGRPADNTGDKCNSGGQHGIRAEANKTGLPEEVSLHLTHNLRIIIQRQAPDDNCQR